MGNYPKVLEAFGVKNDIGSMVTNATNNFDVSKMKPEDSLLNIGLAPSFGPEDSLKDSFKTFDNELKVIILGATNAIRKMPPHTRNWEGVVAEFSNTAMLELKGKEIRRVDQFLSESSSDFKTDGSPETAIVKKVESWFTKFINDEDILRSTGVNIKALAKIVAQSGATITDFESFWSKKERHERTILEFGVLRYPDISHPRIQIYKIKLTAWSDCTRILWHQEDKNGITGEFVERIYVPRKAVMERLSSQVMDRAAKESEDLLFG